MQPLLSIRHVPPEAAASARVLGGRATTAEAELQHRRLHLVWANDETLETEAPTLGTALIQHGLKEWMGADGATRLLDAQPLTHGRRAALAAMARGLAPALEACETENAMAIVVCRDTELAAQWISQRVALEHCMLMAVGAPYSGPSADAASVARSTSFPLPLANKPANAATIWLGAPRRGVAFQIPVANGLHVDAQHVKASTVGVHLADAQERVIEIAPATLICILYLDDVCLRAGSTQGLPAEAFAATLRWLQAQDPWVVVFMVSHERIATAGRSRAAELARHLGGALLKHRGLKRRGWGEPGAVASLPDPPHALPIQQDRNSCIESQLTKIITA